MSEPNHLPKANHLRFSFALAFIVVVGLGILGIQKFLQWKAEAALEQQRKEYATRPTRNPATQEPVLETHEEAKPKPVIRQRLAAKTPETNPTQETAPESPAPPQPEASSASSAPVIPSSGGAVLPPRNNTNSTIFGTVVLRGTPPREKVIEPLINDAICGKLWTNLPTTRFYITGGLGELANVFVHIKRGVPLKSYSSLGDVSLDQKNCFYEPYILGLMVNQTLRIKNSDAVLHNVHATPINNPEFNFAQPIQNQVTGKTFSKPEQLIRIKCDVHPWMFAYVGVVDHPYFTVTDETGTFAFNDLPDGIYVVEAIHQKAGRQSTEVLVRNGKVESPVLITLTVPQN